MSSLHQQQPSAAASAALPATDPAGPPPLEHWGWDDGFAAEFAAFADDPELIPGRIIRVDRGRCEAATRHGVCQASTTALRSPDETGHPCTGDWAVLAPAETAGEWHVRHLLPRRTALLRSGSTKASRGQVLAANADLAIVAVSLVNDFAPARLERFVALAWASGSQPVVVLTKVDLVEDAEHLRSDAEAAAPGVPVLVVSAHTGDGLDELAALLRGRTSLLLGVSGAGKSTLANALTGQQWQDVRAVRDRDGRGRHTTTTRDLLPLPTGGVLIDTPGLRGVGLWDAAEGVGRTFLDIEELAADCRFGDCSHHTEPGCEVRAAIDDGSLPERRLESYRKLLRENAYLAARKDARLRAEMRRTWKLRAAEGQRRAQVKYGSRGKPPRHTGW